MYKNIQWSLVWRIWVYKWERRWLHKLGPPFFTSLGQEDCLLIMRGLHLNMTTHKLFTKKCNSSKTQLAGIHSRTYLLCEVHSYTVCVSIFCLKCLAFGLKNYTKIDVLCCKSFFYFKNDQNIWKNCLHKIGTLCWNIKLWIFII
jgi:hypothetical protein